MVLELPSTLKKNIENIAKEKNISESKYKMLSIHFLDFL